MIKKMARSFLKNKLGKKKYQHWFEAMHRIALKGMNIGGEVDIDSNGESHILSYIKTLSNNPIIFDVGANKGEYTKQIKKKIPNAKVYAFEPSYYTYQLLIKNLQGEQVKINNIGISDKVEKVTLYTDFTGSALASMYPRKLDCYHISMEHQEIVQMNTIDEYCKEHKILQIDLLKLDIEGNEIRALNGARKMFQDKKIKCIQFEFGGCNIDSKTYFRDFWYILKDFHIYRIVKDGIYPITQYNESLEQFGYTNYFARLKE